MGKKWTHPSSHHPNSTATTGIGIRLYSKTQKIKIYNQRRKVKKRKNTVGPQTQVGLGHKGKKNEKDALEGKRPENFYEGGPTAGRWGENNHS